MAPELLVPGLESPQVMRGRESASAWYARWREATWGFTAQGSSGRISRPAGFPWRARLAAKLKQGRRKRFHEPQAQLAGSVVWWGSTTVAPP